MTEKLDGKISNQCQLLTFVASGRSSTIHRGSPSPHFAMTRRKRSIINNQINLTVNYNYLTVDHNLIAKGRKRS